MFMRYCGGGPGHSGLPTCSIAWGLTTEPQIQPVNSALPDCAQDEDSPSESENDDNGSNYEPNPFDLLLEEEPTGNLGYGF
jgi:hypothetical protein